MEHAREDLGAVQHRPADDPVVGWRYWQLAEGQRLRSVSHRRFEWPPGRPLRATCAAGGHPAPAERCNCGIYAALDLATLRERGMCLVPEALVVGEVALWGRVASDGDGHRGEYAYPKTVLLVDGTLPDGDRPAVMGDLAAYGVPVGSTSLDEAVGEVSAGVLAHQAMSLSRKPPV
ncbi:MAG: hypothetical protein M3N31_07595 [Actinomycetota bacterium]|nr:hypothetical protein [Actinomycetota bacterium]